MFCAKPRFTWRAYGARWGGSSLPRPLPALRSPQGATDMHDRHAPHRMSKEHAVVRIQYSEHQYERAGRPPPEHQGRREGTSRAPRSEH